MIKTAAQGVKGWDRLLKFPTDGGNISASEKALALIEAGYAGHRFRALAKADDGAIKVCKLDVQRCSPVVNLHQGSMRVGCGSLRAILLGCLLVVPQCDSTKNRPTRQLRQQESLVNLAHLDHLGQDIQYGGGRCRIIHIYAEAPDYAWVADDDEGVAAVDDAARAAIVYLRHFQTTGEADSQGKAEALLRFIMYMQSDDGLFYNFVWDDTLRINTAHVNSRADEFGWWAARGVWALGMGACVLKDANPAFARTCVRRIRLTLPHLRRMQARYGQTTQQDGRTLPRWLVHETAADATSALLMGLVALNRTYPDPEVRTLIERFAEGIAMMQYGTMNEFPYGAHASWDEGWHGWGNAQTQALSEAGITASAKREVEHFYSRLLVNGWLHSLPLSKPAEARQFEQIASAVRCVAVGLIRLFEATGDVRYAQMAGLAASWFTGNNVAGVAMYEPKTGRGFDGISSPSNVNRNAGAESTIEALFTILEVERHPEARRWLFARGENPVQVKKEGKSYAYRLFQAGTGDTQRRLGVVMNLSDERLEVLEGTELEVFLTK